MTGSLLCVDCDAQPATPLHAIIHIAVTGHAVVRLNRPGGRP